MLSLKTVECAVDDVGGTTAAAEYILARDDGSGAFARGAYYVSEGDTEDEGQAVWHGSSSALSQLGVEPGSAVSRPALVAALVGRHATTGEQVRRPGFRTLSRDDGSETRQAVVKSVDMTFSVPKSLSVVWSQASPQERTRIEADVLDAARETIDHMATTKSAVHRRTPEGDRVREPAAGVAAALSLHVTARRAHDDAAPAPQLHVHGLVVGLLRSDGRLVSPDPWNWFKHGAAREGGALGRAVLAERLQARGYAVESDTGKGGRYFELAGVPATLRQALSGRSREVALRAQALELAFGRAPRGAALAVLAKETRAPKEHQDHAEVAAWWDAVASEHGFGAREADRLRSGAVLGASRTGERDLVMAVMRRLHDEGPTVTTAEARAIVLEAAAGRTSPTAAVAVFDRLIEQGQVIPLEEDRITTRPIRELERRALTDAVAAGRRVNDPLGLEAVQSAIDSADASLGDGRALDEEQRAAVDIACAGHGWTNVTGRAGTGKGPVLEAVAHAYRAAGWQVVATAVDGTTAQRLAAQIHDRGYTIDSLLHRIASGRLIPTEGTLLVLDEASKVDTGRWAELTALTAAHGVRVLAVGDTGQLDAIQLSGLFAEIVRRTPTVELGQIRRHRDPADPASEHAWLGRYQAALHDGRGADAVAILREHDAIQLHDTRAEAMVALVRNWNSWRHEHAVDQTMLLVHGTNGDVDTVNHLAQRVRIDAGELGAASVAAPDRDYRLHAGDLAVVRGAPIFLPPERGGGRIENGTTLRVTGVDELADHLAVEWQDPQHGPRQAVIDLAPLRHELPGLRRPAIRLAYAQHPNPAQGATVERTAVLGHPVADRKAVYVADTRAKHDHTVHLAREDLGFDGTDDDRLARYTDAISATGGREASVRHRRRERY